MNNPLILYDGVCILCSRFIHFVAARDAARYHFVPLQSPYGAILAKKHRISTTNPQTFALIQGNSAQTKSTATLTVLTSLPHYRWLKILTLIPTPVRDAAYTLLARHRYTIFGRYAQCPLPPKNLKSRILTTPPKI